MNMHFVLINVNGSQLLPPSFFFVCMSVFFYLLEQCVPLAAQNLSSATLVTTVWTKVVALVLWVVRVWFCLIEVQGIHVFVLVPTTALKHVEIHSSNRKNYHYP